MISPRCAVDEADWHIACVKEMIADYLHIVDTLERTGQLTTTALKTLESLVLALRTIEACLRSLREELAWQFANDNTLDLIDSL